MLTVAGTQYHIIPFNETKETYLVKPLVNSDLTFKYFSTIIKNCGKKKMQVFDICQYLGFLFTSYCVVQVRQNVREKPKNTERFEIEFTWTHINFTWHSPEEYRSAITTKRYIPENNAIAGIKAYKGRMYIALPRIRNGTPVTLAYVSKNTGETHNVYLKPYPSWKMNVRNDCSSLQNVQSMEIDSSGIMWVLDGNRFNDFTKCPPKIVLLDLNRKGKVIQSFNFPNELSMREGGYLNDIVVDESDGGYGFITETSTQDPGLIVYSRLQNRAWKIRDRSMYAELDTVMFEVDGVQNSAVVPIDGIAMDPINKDNKERLVYYTALTGINMYAISNQILKNELLCKSGMWRHFVKVIGKKHGQSDGMIVDNLGNMFYGVLNLYSIAKWDTKKPFNESKIIDTNVSTFIWPDSFTIDSDGFLYVVANGIHKYFNQLYNLNLNNEVKFRILRLYVGSNSYLYQ